MVYSEKVLDHFMNPRNVGSFDEQKTNVGTGIVGALEYGEMMRLQIEIEVKSGLIKNAKFKTYGCGSAIACTSFATEWLIGKRLTQAAMLQSMEIVDALTLPRTKIHCAVLVKEVIQMAIVDYQRKNKK